MFLLKREYLALQRLNINFKKLNLLKDCDSQIIQLFTLNLSVNTSTGLYQLQYFAVFVTFPENLFFAELFIGFSRIL